jgi:hypothetical protein
VLAIGEVKSGAGEVAERHDRIDLVVRYRFRSEATWPLVVSTGPTTFRLLDRLQPIPLIDYRRIFHHPCYHVHEARVEVALADEPERPTALGAEHKVNHSTISLPRFFGDRAVRVLQPLIRARAHLAYHPEKEFSLLLKAWSFRLRDDAARPSALAITRIDRPATSPRDISSRSAIVSAQGDRLRSEGRIPPVGARTAKIVV